jgi:hypothetical protein
MEAKPDFTDWRELLGALISNTQEKKRLADEAKIRPITLKRWADRTSQPREENLLRLAQGLPAEKAALFLSLAEKEFPLLSQIHLEQNDISAEIEAELYTQVLQAYAKTPSPLARQLLQQIILKHAIQHLDPTGVGMSITLLCCIPPRPGEKVRALCQNGGLGTAPWPSDLERKVLFVGAESLAGSAVLHCRTMVAESRDDPVLAQYNWDLYEESAAAAPILRQACVAGALVASSARPRHFTQKHEHLLELYAHLIVLLFSSSDFYNLQGVELGIMPRIQKQEVWLQDIDRRATAKLSELQGRQQLSITMQQARQYVWQDIAADLLQQR